MIIRETATRYRIHFNVDRTDPVSTDYPTFASRVRSQAHRLEPLTWLAENRHKFSIKMNWPYTLQPYLGYRECVTLWITDAGASATFREMWMPRWRAR